MKNILLAEEYIEKMIKAFALKSAPFLILFFGACMSKDGKIIGSVFQNATEYIDKLLVGLGIGITVIVLIDIICLAICMCINATMREVQMDVANEIEYYRDLKYPIIFLNETGKSRKWMNGNFMG